MPTQTRCPRCTHTYDPDTAARSRVTLARDIDICPACGTEEAHRDTRGLAPVPHGEWPVTPPPAPFPCHPE